MNLKQLIKEVERLKHISNHPLNYTVDKVSTARITLLAIKQTVEAVDKDMMLIDIDDDSIKDWQTLKKLLGVK